MKKTDIKILSHLRTNGRMALTELSRQTGLPVSTIHEKLKQMIAKGMVKPTMLLNFQKLGFSTRAWMLLSVESSEKEELYSLLKSNDFVNSMFRINNGWSVLCDCVFRDMQSFENFVELLESKFQIKQKQVHYVLEELKEEEFLANPSIAESVMNKL